MDKEKMAGDIQRICKNGAVFGALVDIVESIQRQTLEEVRKLAGEIGGLCHYNGYQTTLQKAFADECMERIMRPKDYLDSEEFDNAMRKFGRARSGYYPESTLDCLENVKRLIREHFKEKP